MAMLIDDAFPSNYIKAVDLKDKTPTVTIERVEMEKVGDEMKLVVYFVKVSRGLVLNKTNANMIATITNSRDAEQWRGHRVMLTRVMVDYQGSRVPGVRIDYPKPAARPVATRPAPTPVADEWGDGETPAQSIP